MKTIHEHIQWAVDLLKNRFIENPKLESQALFSHASGFSKEDQIRESTQEISSKASNMFQNLVEQRSKNIPMAYLTHEKEFYSMRFFVNEHVLIPRPETESLIDLFEKKIGNREVKVCDVGTGSGAIAITLKKRFPKLHVTGIDASSKALEVAKKNALFHRVDIDWIESDLFEKTNTVFDVVVANLPYIPTKDVPNLPETVRFEPLMALDGGEDGLDIYDRLISQLEDHLSPNGEILFEFGINQTQALRSKLEKSFFEMSCLQDLAGLDRIMYAKRK